MHHLCRILGLKEVLPNVLVSLLVLCFVSVFFRKRNVSELQLQEVRATDDNVVVPSDLHLPQDAEVQKYAAHMLGLCFPFPTCSGD